MALGPLSRDLHHGQMSYRGKCWLLLPLSLVPQPILCGSATTPGTLPSFSRQK